MLRIHGRDVFIDRPKCKIKLDEIEKAEVKVPIVRSQNAKVIVDGCYSYALFEHCTRQ